MKSVTAFIATGLGFAAVDSIWLITMSTRLYKPEIGELMAENFRLGPAVVFYLLYIAGILIFAVQPALASGKWQTALVQGALFGFFCYMTYNLTNLAVIRDFPSKLALIDIVWGSILTASCSVLAYYVSQYSEKWFRG